ncbi:DegT/DnrJ/EryC1/StrS family aminotransferase [Alphaproteobacteria bacterium US3C007]|nr:DegT/DnrJ/EryC1/StrS family aminotransferase [Alphaproteobacteria bacterium US3C007]
MVVKLIDLDRVNGSAFNSFLNELIRLKGSDEAFPFWINGKNKELFEDSFGKEISGCDYNIGVGNGYDAIRIGTKALISAGILKIGDEVLVPTNTFIASASALIDAGLKVKFVDVEKDDGLASVNCFTEGVTERTKAIMCVHLYGKASKLKELYDFCEVNNIVLMEDCAQAHGARSDQIVCGSAGNISFYSFYPGKSLGALGDGGMISTCNLAIANHCRMISNYGSREKYKYESIGQNSRLDEIQAIFLIEKLKTYFENCKKRIALAKLYCDSINNPNIELMNYGNMDGDHIFHLFPVLVRNRKTFQSYMSKCEIETGVHYPQSLDKLEIFKNVERVKIKNAHIISESIVSLPMHECLERAEINHVIEMVNNFSC